ncbi:hypothetical protein M413DRAFT_442285 [Hebeloma cylindrosporum]|uniref:Uncharacterized protein n=1 Tax=Hebeloma cylindrosporum TaxID=76867 RepID=A0A0C2Y732_HEBCY|nr:hypothetical protein M413DRAFT_442285 [Hebeloma cylindrosporum h7]
MLQEENTRSFGTTGTKQRARYFDICLTYRVFQEFERLGQENRGEGRQDSRRFRGCDGIISRLRC